MSAVVFENVTKLYRGGKRYVSLRDDLTGRLAALAGRPQKRELVRALDGVSLEIEEGESFGLIGPNGAGKTTALKLTARISYPTSGRIRVRGRVGALIEVGTGMHPELTGRENVGLYGRILGHTGRDIARRFDDIVEFAGIGGAIEQPVKHFSSGMVLRLGFSLAAHLEPDVLLVDEALAVGDASFQQRCMQKMEELADEGRTLVLVSHSMDAIESVCSRAVLLDRGRVVADGPARDTIREYLRVLEQHLPDRAVGGVGSAVLTLERATLHDAGGNEIENAVAGEPLTVRVHYNAIEPIPRPHFNLAVGSGGRRTPLFSATMLYDGECPDLLEGRGTLDCTFHTLPLRPRTYEVWCGVRGGDGVAQLVHYSLLRRFRVLGEAEGPGKAGVARGATLPPVDVPYRWSFNGDEVDGAR